MQRFPSFVHTEAKGMRFFAALMFAAAVIIGTTFDAAAQTWRTDPADDPETRPTDASPEYPGGKKPPAPFYDETPAGAPTGFVDDRQRPDAFALRPLLNYTSVRLLLDAASRAERRADGSRLVLSKYIIGVRGDFAFSAYNWLVSARVEAAVATGDRDAVLFQGAMLGARRRVFAVGDWQGVFGLEVDVYTLSFRRFAPDVLRPFPFFTFAWHRDRFQVQPFVGVGVPLYLTRESRAAAGGRSGVDLNYGVNGAVGVSDSIWLAVEPSVLQRLTNTPVPKLYAYLTLGPAYRSQRISAVLGVRIPLNHRREQDDFVPMVSIAMAL